MEQANLIEFPNLSTENKKYLYTVMIILNRPVCVEQYIMLRKISDYVICADGAANRIYELKDKDKYKPSY